MANFSITGDQETLKLFEEVTEVEKSNNDTLKNLYNITVKIVLKNLFDEKEINGARLRAFYLKLKPLYSRYVNGKL